MLIYKEYNRIPLFGFTVVAELYFPHPKNVQQKAPLEMASEDTCNF